MQLTTPVRWVVGATLTMAMALGIGRFAYTPLLPQMTEALGWTYGQAGDVASANFLGYLAGALLAPFASRSPQVRSWVALGLMASVLTTFLGAEAQTYLQWLLLRFASGVASAVCLVVLTTHLMQTLSRNDAGHLGNIHFAGVGLGILLCMAGTFAGGDVMQQWSRQGLLAAGCAAMAWLLLREGPWLVAPVAAAGHVQRELPGVWQLVAGYGLFGFGYVVSATFVVAMGTQLQTQGGVSPHIAWVVVGAATVPSVYLWQWWGHRQGLYQALVWSYAVLCVGAFLAGWAEQLATLLLAAVLLGGTFGGITALGLSAGRVMAPHRVAAIVSSMTVAFSVGQLLGPAVAGRLADGTGGFFWPSVLAAMLTLLALLLVPRSLRVNSPGVSASG